MCFPRFLAAAVLCLVLAAPIATRAADTDPAAGARAFRRCQACHTVNEGGRARIGPNLYGILNRPVAAVEGFRYSKALSAFGGVWTENLLDQFLARPTALVPGTRMVFPGLRKDRERADLIAYLGTLGDGSLPAPSTPVSADEEADDSFGLLVAAPGAELVYNSCTACHSERIVIQQGLTREGWDELLDWMTEEQSMPEPDSADRTGLLDYLTKHYGPDRPNFPRN